MSVKLICKMERSTTAFRNFNLFPLFRLEIPVDMIEFGMFQNLFNGHLFANFLGNSSMVLLI